MAVAVGLLGGFRVAVDGVPVELGGRQPSLVIASLVLAERRALSFERLIDLLWGDDPPLTARRTLQSYVADIRRRLADERDALSASGTGYVLSIARGDVDLFAFADAVLRAKAGMDAEPAAASAALSAALDSWATPLDGLRPTLALSAVLAPYEALRLEALETLNDVELGSDAARAVGRLETLVPRAPDPGALLGPTRRRAGGAGATRRRAPGLPARPRGAARAPRRGPRTPAARRRARRPRRRVGDAPAAAGRAGDGDQPAGARVDVGRS